MCGMCGNAWTVSLWHAYRLIADSQPEAFVAQARAKPTPSEFADLQTWSKFQQRDDAILCLRPADRRGWPISLMHKAFCDFTRHFLQPRLDTETTEYLLMAGKLCDEMPSAFGSEIQRRDAFDAIFSSLDDRLTRHNEYRVSASASNPTVRESGARPDVARSIPGTAGPLILLLEDHKNGDGDSYMQVCRSYEVLCGGPKVEQLVKFGNPMFLVCIQGIYEHSFRIMLVELGPQAHTLWFAGRSNASMSKWNPSRRSFRCFLGMVLQVAQSNWPIASKP